ncbi:Zinc finger protein, partial [Plecturocebus cupreus]
MQNLNGSKMDSHSFHPGWSAMLCHHAQLIFVYLVETGFHHVGQACLELLTSDDPPALALQSAGIRDKPLLLFTKLECSGVISAHHNLHLQGTSHSPASASRVAEIIGRYILTLSSDLECSGTIIAHCGLKLVGSSNPPASASPGVETTGMSRRAQLGSKNYRSSRLSKTWNPSALKIILLLL